MRNKLDAVLVTLLGVLVLLPLLGVTALGTLTEGTLAWIIALAILVIGIVGLFQSFGK